MRQLFDALASHARRSPDRVAFSDPGGTIARAALMADAARLVAALPASARVVGLFLPNGRAYAVAQMALVASGRIAVPLPAFFSPAQIAHVVRDAGIELVLVAPGDEGSVPDGIARQAVAVTGAPGAPPVFQEGYGTLVYTSGSTGQPKGVRHESGQVGWSAAALAEAIGAQEDDSYLSVLPLSLLLESICALFIPALVGGRVHFETAISERIGRGAVRGIAEAFARHRPTAGVLVPELLRLWVVELSAARMRAPDSLRFVAVGGAAVPPRVAEVAWQLGIPVHEGYGLSECGSVVAVNRPGRRVAGTVGEPLAGLALTVVDGELHVDGPCVTDGYLRGASAPHPWPTGDLATLGADGRLRVSGRKDNLVVTPLGRNVSPEWVETALLGDPFIAACAVTAAPDGLAALVVPASATTEWFARASRASIDARIADACAGLPAYARPARTQVVDMAAAKAAGLFTDNGRIRRQVARDLILDHVAAAI
ncbi:AMP-binding protein [Xanthobacter sp. V3C-3]|uniref:AMP-binding protein n=1 Tax=Xanthobacter lutulentifluminis TaxID=3119935 RepID=UPI003727CC29